MSDPTTPDRPTPEASPTGTAGPAATNAVGAPSADNSAAATPATTSGTASAATSTNAGTSAPAEGTATKQSIAGGTSDEKTVGWTGDERAATAASTSVKPAAEASDGTAAGGEKSGKGTAAKDAGAGLDTGTANASARNDTGTGTGAGIRNAADTAKGAGIAKDAATGKDADTGNDAGTGKDPGTGKDAATKGRKKKGAGKVRGPLVTVGGVVAVLVVLGVVGYVWGLGPLNRLNAERGITPPAQLAGLDRITDPEIRERAQLDRTRDALSRINDGKKVTVEAYGTLDGKRMFVVIALRGKVDIDKTVADSGARPEQIKKIGRSTCVESTDNLPTQCYRGSSTLTVITHSANDGVTADAVGPVAEEAFNAMK